MSWFSDPGFGKISWDPSYKAPTDNERVAEALRQRVTPDVDERTLERWYRDLDDLILSLEATTPTGVQEFDTVLEGFKEVRDEIYSYLRG